MKETVGEKTLKQRMQMFWSWFAGRQEMLRGLTENGSTLLASAIVNHSLSRLSLPSIASVSNTPDGPELMMCPRADKTEQFVCRYWAQTAPDIAWRIQPFGHPSEEEITHVLNAMGVEYHPEDYTIYCVVDDAEQKYQLNVVAPVFSENYRSECRTFCRMLFYLLLGATYAELCIGEIACAPAEPDPPFPGEKMNLRDFCAMVRRTPEERPWLTMRDPTAICYGYHGDEETGEGMREDIQIGFSRHPQLLASPFSESEALMKMGGVFCYLYYPSDSPDPRAQANKRSELTARVEKIMDEYQLGYVLGTAQGSDFCYIDLFVTDEPTFYAIFRDMVPLLDEVLDIDYFGRSITGEWIQ